jgi:transcriptional regulator with PAS, ATPase and Fis domain
VARSTSLKELLTQTERMVIMETLARNKWNRLRTAQILGISRTNLWERMRKLDIKLAEVPRDRPGRRKQKGGDDAQG